MGDYISPRIKLPKIPSEEESKAHFGEYFDEMKTNPNNISFWFPRIENCGIKVPRTVIVPFPKDILWGFWDEKIPSETLEEQLYAYVKKEVMPRIDELGLYVFLKNGTFSYKFDARNCIVRKSALEIASGLFGIMESSCLAEANGETEVAVRELIFWNDEDTPCIYNGLPLRPEIRIFYDFDKREVIGSVNYWDYDKCMKGMYSATDKIIFESRFFYVSECIKMSQHDAERLIAESMKSVDMKGKWSIDLLFESGKVWLIDMARAERSAYFERFTKNEDKK